MHANSLEVWRIWNYDLMWTIILNIYWDSEHLLALFLISKNEKHKSIFQNPQSSHVSHESKDASAAKACFLAWCSQ